MPISEIEIVNCKSVKKVNLPLDGINFLIGHNGAGKSNILKSINFFYNNLTEVNVDNSLFDKSNPYNKYFEVSFTYDFNEMSNRLTHLNKNIEDGQLKKFIDYYFFFINAFCNTNFSRVTLTLRQYKDNKQEWLINGLAIQDTYDKASKELLKAFFKFRALIKNMFPIYFTDVRHIDLTNWDNLWNIIGDLNKINIDEQIVFVNEIEKKIIEILGSKSGKRYEKITKSIDRSFDNNNIQVKEFNLKELFSQIYKVQQNGEKFNYNNLNLDYFSDGMNSYNYLEILLAITSNIASLKLKNPLIIIDEPEMGLYPKFIDGFSERLIKGAKEQQVIVSTHSPRLVKNVLKSNIESNFYHLIIENQYTSSKKIKNLVNDKEKYRISEKEASFYFSKCILFVEGASELELFQNDGLIELFSVFKDIDLSVGGADDVVLELCCPERRNTNIPYLILIDLDKIITFKEKENDKIVNKFELSNTSVNPLCTSVEKNSTMHNKEKMYYGIKRIETINNRININDLISKSSFNLDPNWFYIEDSSFEKLKLEIKQYCLNYKVFTLQNTIEGALINKDNHWLVYEWLRSYLKKDSEKRRSAEKIYNYLDNESYKVTVLRLLVRGKYDNLNNILSEEESKKHDKSVEEIYFKIYKTRQKKTSGWIKSFLDYFFINYVQCKKNRDEKREVFENYFPELFSIIEYIEEIMYKKQDE